MAIGFGDEGRRTRGAAGQEQPLLSNGSSFFEIRNRPRRDTPWLVAYFVVLVAAIAGGVFSFVHRNTGYAELVFDKYKDPRTCPIDATTHASRRLLQQSPDDPSPFDLDLFMRAAGAWVGASVGGAILVGLLFVWLVRVSPASLVAVALALQVGVPAATGVALLVQGAVVGAVIMLVMAALMVLLIVLWRRQIELVTRLLGLSGHGLTNNPGLVPLSLGLQLGLVGLLELPLLLCTIAAAMNGSLVYNAGRVDQGTAAKADECVDADGNQVPCCIWQVESWVPVYMTFAGVAMTWSMFLVFQVKMFTVAGATAQWYFQSVSTGAGGSSGSGGITRNPGSRTLRALRFAVGPSLGSLCLSSAVLTLVSMIRQAMEKARRERGQNLLLACAAACLSLLLSLLEFVTRFATVRMAITGEAFMAAGRNVVELLKRNAMDAFGVWWLPPMILQSCSFLLALAWAVVVFFASYATTWSHQGASSPDQATTSAFLTSLVGFLAAWAVLGFLASLLLNVIEALFVCFAMDRDVGQVSMVEVHNVMSKLPTVGAVVQQPDGGLAYGAPQEQQGLLRGSDARV